MKQITCTGPPREIGIQHGRAAKVEIDRGLAFYADLFVKNAELSWSEACATAAKFEKILRTDWPAYVHEMEGKHRSFSLRCAICCMFHKKGKAVSSAKSSALLFCLLDLGTVAPESSSS